VAIAFSATSGQKLLVLTVMARSTGCPPGEKQLRTPSDKRLVLTAEILKRPQRCLRQHSRRSGGAAGNGHRPKFDSLQGRSSRVGSISRTRRPLCARRGSCRRVGLISLNAGEKLARLVSTASGWAVLDNAGRFDGSETGLEAIKLVTEEVSLDVSAFSKRYFEPGILSNYVSGELQRSTAVESVFEQGLKLPPSVDVVFPDPGRGKPARRSTRSSWLRIAAAALPSTAIPQR
jgi:hypothetical protein